MPDTELIIKIKLDGGAQVSGGLDNVSGSAQRVTNAATGTEGAIGGLGASLGGWIMVGRAALDAFKGLASTAEEWIAKANEAEEAQLRLNIACQQTGIADAIPSVSAYADEIESLTTHDGDAVKGGMALLQTMGKFKDGEELKGATKAAIGLADTLGIDLDQAFNMVGKAAGGNEVMLQRTGLGYKNLNGLLADSNALFETSAALRDTDAGKAKVAAVQYENLQEQLGAVARQVKTAIIDEAMPLLKEALDWFKENGSETIRTIRVAIALGIGGFKEFIGTIKFFADFWGVVFGSAIDIVCAYASGIIGIFSNVGQIIASFAKAAYYAMTGDFAKAKEEIAGVFTGAKGIADTVKESVYDINESVSRSGKFIGESFGENIVNPIRNMSTSISNAIEADVVPKAGEIGKRLGKPIGKAAAKAAAEAIARELAINKAMAGANILDIYSSQHEGRIKFLQDEEKASEDNAKILYDIGEISAEDYRTLLQLRISYIEGFSEQEINARLKLQQEIAGIDEAIAAKGIEEAEKELEEKKKLHEQEEATLMQFFSTATQIGDARIANVESERQREIAAIEASGMAEEKKRAKIDEINKVYDAKEKSAKAAMKPVKIAEAISNIALGITKALGSYIPPLNFIMAALVGAAGAVQLGVIMAQPFRRGGKFLKGVPGYFEGEGNELIAPEGDFLSVMRAELIPALLRSPEAQISGKGETKIYKIEQHHHYEGAILPSDIPGILEYQRKYEKKATQISEAIKLD